MALRPARSDREIPKGAVVLDIMQAMAHQAKIIEKWEPKSEVFFLRHGLNIMGAAAGLTSFLMHGEIRRKLKLVSYGANTSLLLTVGSSVVLLCSTYTLFLRRKILLINKDTCPACIDVKGILLQNTFGILQPLFAASAVNFGIAYKTATVNMPSMMDIKRMSKYWWTVVKPMSNLFLYMSLGHTLLAGYIIHKQLSEIYRVQESLMIQEKFLEESGAIKQTFHL